MDIDDPFVVERLDGRRSLCLSTLARETVTESGALHLGGDKGLFIYEVDERLGSACIEVLAKAVSVEAAMRLIDLWREKGIRGQRPALASASSKDAPAKPAAATAEP